MRWVLGENGTISYLKRDKRWPALAGVGRRWLFNLFSSVQKATKCLEAKRLAKRDSA